MADTTEGLRIHIHLGDGSVAKFHQVAEAEGQQILTSITPAKLFGQPSIVIGGGYSASLYPMSAVTHIVFQHAQLPNWADPNAEIEMSEVPREQFLAAANPANEKLQPRMRNPDETGGLTASFGRLVMRGGGKVYVQIVTHVAGKLERRQMIQRMLQAPYYYVKCEGGGILVNNANLIGISLFPGPAELPSTAWPAHHTAG